MKDLNKNKWEDEWQKTFEDASLQPPQRVWQGVERALDANGPQALPPTYSPKRYLWAALLVLLFSVGGGATLYWSGDAEPRLVGTPPASTSPQSAAGTHSQAHATPQSHASSEQTLGPSTPQVASEPSPQGVATAARSTTAPQPALADYGSVLEVRGYPGPRPTKQAARRGERSSSIALNQPAKPKATPATDASAYQRSQALAQEEPVLRSTPVPTEPTRSIGQQPTSPISDSQALNEQPVIAQQRAVLEVSLLVGRRLSLSGPSFALPSVSAPTSASPLKPATPIKRWWVGASITLANFDPIVRTNQGLAYSSALGTTGGTLPSMGGQNYSSDPLNSRAKESVQAELYVKYQWKKHWYWQSGLQYLRGNTVLQSNALVINRSNSVRESLYSILLSNTKSTSTSFVNDNLVVQSNLALPSQYHYLSVPVSIGYEARLIGPLKWHATTGLSGDIFLKHRIQGNDPTLLNAVTYRPSDKIYREVNLSAQVSVGLSYIIAKRWAATLDANYRKTMLNATPSDASITVRPRAAGVGIGLAYRF